MARRERGTVASDGGGSASADAATAWQAEYDARMGKEGPLRNRSGIEVEPLYGPPDGSSDGRFEDLGYPGQPPFTRGIHATMHRGRRWSQRLVVGLGFPEDYNQRMRSLYAAGIHGLFLAPCNSHMRGFDADEVAPALLGTCGTVINTVEDLARALDGLPLDEESVSLGDCGPFTLAGMLLALTRRNGKPWASLWGTTNQSDYLSHYAALHMFFRLSLPGARRVLLDHIEFMSRHAPRWNPLSVVGQHVQQAGATPAEAMGLTLSSAIQHAVDLAARGLDPDEFLPRFSFFFDVSLSFFEEIAKFRAGRRLWARIARDRLGARNPAAWRMRYHVQTSGAELTRQQPLNNVARVTVQAMAAIFGGPQSVHTDAYDEAFGSPTEDSARVAAATQNILAEEAHLADVIDPLGGSYYVESLTDAMEAEIEAVIARIDAAGGMFDAVGSGLVQTMLGESALAHQARIESGEETVVGVNAYRAAGEEDPPPTTLERPSRSAVDRYLAGLRRFKSDRDGAAVRRALDRLARASGGENENVFEQVVEAAAAGATHGEICGCIRRVLGEGKPLAVI